MSQDDYSLPDVVKIRLQPSCYQDIALSLQNQYESGLYQIDILKCQDGELNVNPLIVQLLFPWLASRFSHTDSPQMILLPEYSQQEIRKQIDTILTAAHCSEQWLKMEKPGNGNWSNSFDNDNALFPKDAFSQCDLKLESKGVTEEYMYDCDVGFDPDPPEVKKTRTRQRNRKRKNVSVGPPEDATSNPSEAIVPNASEKPVFFVSVGGIPINLAGTGDKPGKNEKRSPVWKFYYPSSSSTATCISCHASLSTNWGSTKGLINHLSAKHPEHYHEFRSIVPKRTLPKMATNSQNILDNVVGETLVDSAGKITKNKKGKRSAVWKFFVPSSTSTATCISCHATRATPKGSTKAMIIHLKTYHPEQYVEFRTSFPEPNVPVGKSTGKSGKRDAKNYAGLCTECGLAVADLAKHQKVHMAVRLDRQQCHLCDSTLSSAYALKIHLETVHEGIKKYHCKFCNKNFICSSHLKRHILTIHGNSKKNLTANCPDCGQQFSYANMRRHRRMVHEGQRQMKKYVCPDPLCKDAFPQKAFLNIHLREIHEIDPTKRKSPKRKPPKRTSDAVVVDADLILKEYPDLLKPEDF